MNGIEEVGRYSDEFAAQTAIAHLRAEGITAKMVTDDAGGVLPSLAMLSGGVRVVVSVDDVERAQEILEGSDTAGPESET